MYFDKWIIFNEVVRGGRLGLTKVHSSVVSSPEDDLVKGRKRTW